MAKKGAARRLAQNNKRLGLLASVLAASLVLFTSIRLIKNRATARFIHYAALLFSATMGATCLGALKLHAAPTYIGGALEDGGADLAIPGGFVSTLHDGIYVSSAALLAGCFANAGLALLGAFPAYGLAKLWSGVIAPWFFTARPEEAEAAEKARAAAEKRAKKAARKGR